MVNFSNVAGRDYQSWRATRRGGADSLVGEVVEYLRLIIQSGQLSPGDRLPPERDLATQLGVARLTLREALKELQREGYLESRVGARGGTFVTELSRPVRRWVARMKADISRLEDILEYRIAVESHAARLAAEQRIDADIEAILAANQALATATNRNEFRRADAMFHTAVARASHSALLIELEPTIRGELFNPVDHLEFNPPKRGAEVEHARIARYISSGSPDAAARAMRQHLEHTRQELRTLLESGDT